MWQTPKDNQSLAHIDLRIAHRLPLACNWSRYRWCHCYRLLPVADDTVPVRTKVTIEYAGMLPVTWPLLRDTLRVPRSVPCAETYPLAEEAVYPQG